MKVAGLILAAGEGRRMGGPKARLLIRGRPLAAWHVAQMREAGLDPVLVVARPADMAWLSAQDITAVASTAADMAGSLAVGLAALEGRARVVIVTPVDVLPGPARAHQALAAALGPPVQAAVTCRAGKRAHPVALTLPWSGVPGPLDAALRELGERCVEVHQEQALPEVELDTPDAVRRETGAPPRFG